MTIIMLIYAAMFAVAFYFINKLIDRYYNQMQVISDLEFRVKHEINELYDRCIDLNIKLDKVNANVDIDKKNIDACANAILNIRNNVGKLGNRLQAIERKGNNE